MKMQSPVEFGKRKAQCLFTTLHLDKKDSLEVF